MKKKHMEAWIRALQTRIELLEKNACVRDTSQTTLIGPGSCLTESRAQRWVDQASCSHVFTTWGVGPVPIDLEACVECGTTNPRVIEDEYVNIEGVFVKKET